jgi:hypothetical protein
MGARFLAVGLVASAAWYAWRWEAYGSSWGSFILHLLAWSFLAAFVGKIVGIALFRRRASSSQHADTHATRRKY